MNVRSMTSVVVLTAAVTLCLGAATVTLEAQDAARAPRNLEEFDAMFRDQSLFDGLVNGFALQEHLALVGALLEEIACCAAWTEHCSQAHKEN